MALTGNQTRHLRALGHHLDPVVQIGKNGITEALVAQLADALAHHELIKVKLLPECPVDRHEAGEELAKVLVADLAQTLGRTLLLWKRNPQAAKVELPRAGAKKAKPKPETASKEASKGKLPPSRAARPPRPDSQEQALSPEPTRRPVRGSRPGPSARSGPARPGRPTGHRTLPRPS